MLHQTETETEQAAYGSNRPKHVDLNRPPLGRSLVSLEKQIGLHESVEIIYAVRAIRIMERLIAIDYREVSANIPALDLSLDNADSVGRIGIDCHSWYMTRV